MVEYSYTAFDGHGAKVLGVIQALSEQDASRQLKAQGLTPVALAPSRTVNKASLSKRKMSASDLELMTSELSMLLVSGVRIDRGLEILAKGSGRSPMGTVLRSLASAVKKGQSLSDAMAEFPVFDPMYLSLVRMGEASGNLAEVFAQLAKELKFQNELRAKVIQSLTYPSIILAVCVLSIVFVFNFIVPRMSGLFAQAQELPIYTEMLLSLSQWMQDYQLWLAGAIGIMVAFAIHLAGKGTLQQSVMKLFYRTPGLKRSVLMLARIQVSSAMAMLLASGVKLDQALKMAADGLRLDELKSALAAARTKVNSGTALTEALAATELYPELSLSLLEVGEESGQLDRVFEEVASRSRREFDGWTSKMTSLLEPLMILFMGGIVGGVVVIMLLSITSLNDVAF